MEFLVFLILGATTMAIVCLLALAGFSFVMTVADEFDFSFPVTLILAIVASLGLPSLCYFVGRLVLGV